jgi:hypothetical protein
MDVTESGITTDERLVQPWKVLPPIDATESGIAIEERLVHP